MDLIQTIRVNQPNVGARACEFLQSPPRVVRGIIFNDNYLEGVVDGSQSLYVCEDAV
jgi:hypothetical protein